MSDSMDQSPAPAGGKLERVLLALANPRDGEDFDGSLDLNKERTAVEMALERLGIRPQVLTKTTRNTFREWIAGSSPQVLHYMGHSELDPETGDGMLLPE